MPPTSPPPTRVTVVHSPACHLCDHARAGLDRLAAEFPITVELIEAGDPRGQALVAEHRAPMYPLVLVDGAYFSTGRLSRKKLRKLLASRTGEAVV